MNKAYVESMKYSRLEVAKSLYKEAVILFFEKRDALAVFYLAKHAYEILRTLVGSHNFLKNDYLTDEAGTQIINYENLIEIGLTANGIDREFFKFNPKINEFILLECAVIFNESLDPQFLFSKVYLIWAMAMYPELFAENFTEKVLEGEGYHIDPYDFEVMLTLLKP